MKQINDLLINGFTAISNVYTPEEIEDILTHINQAGTHKVTFRKSTDLFAIRQLLKELPDIADILFNDRLKTILQQVSGNRYFVVKSIYFDKPATSNWYVSYHQDLTISVDKKKEIAGFTNWTIKQNQFSVQPPLAILQNIITLRIHLDQADENNGALKVIPGSHLKEIYRPETIDWTLETEATCSVSKGGIMLMKPLLLHSSGRTTNNMQRRVIHIELSDQELPEELAWAERLHLDW